MPILDFPKTEQEIVNCYREKEILHKKLFCKNGIKLILLIVFDEVRR